jgi:hypothetical protein
MVRVPIHGELKRMPTKRNIQIIPTATRSTDAFDRDMLLERYIVDQLVKAGIRSNFTRPPPSSPPSSKRKQNSVVIELMDVFAGTWIEVEDNSVVRLHGHEKARYQLASILRPK